MACKLCDKDTTIELYTYGICSDCHIKLREWLYTKDGFAFAAMALCCIDLTKLLGFADEAVQRSKVGRLPRIKHPEELKLEVTSEFKRVAQNAIEEASKRAEVYKSAGKCMNCYADIPIGGRPITEGATSPLCERCANQFSSR